MPKINFNNIRFDSAYGTSKQLPKSNKCEISLVGKSNVGKSSLLNKLCNNKKLAKVSSTPGKTTTINFFDLDCAYLVDLPGYGFAKRSKSEKNRWSELIEGYFNQDREFGLVVILIDIRHIPGALDSQMINYVHQMGLPFLIALTKADKLSKQQQSRQKAAIKKFLNLNDRVPYITTSSNTGSGIQELKDYINLCIS